MIGVNGSGAACITGIVLAAQREINVEQSPTMGCVKNVDRPLVLQHDFSGYSKPTTRSPLPFRGMECTKDGLSLRGFNSRTVVFYSNSDQVARSGDGRKNCNDARL